MTDSSSRDPLIGQTLGPCRIDAVLGSGGNGVVYKAHHNRLDRPVAIKVLSSEAGNSARGRALLKEARAAARIEDARIIQIYDVGEEKGVHYIIMQLVNGVTLEQMVEREGKMTQPEALALVKEVAMALSAAHDKGVLHRDIKPANIIIDQAGKVRLMDFGLAVVGKDPDARKKEPAGTFDFSSPEQLFGAEPDPRSDLYALGATYFFALTGTPPYAVGSDFDQVIQNRDFPVPDVRETNREVTPMAAALIMRLMEKDPEKRPASAEELLKELNASGMVLEVDTSGSPFKILPPPVEPKAGFAPPVAKKADAPTDPEYTPPGPLPSVGRTHTDPTWMARGIYMAGSAALILRSGPGESQADWLAAGVTAALIEAVLISGKPTVARRGLWGAAAASAALVCLYKFGLSPGSWGFPSGQSMESLILLGTGGILGAAGAYLGLVESEKPLPLGLLSVSVVCLIVWAALSQLPAGSPWSQVGGLVVHEFSNIAGSAGLLRWGGILLVFGGSYIFFPGRKSFGERTKIVNWSA